MFKTHEKIPKTKDIYNKFEQFVSVIESGNHLISLHMFITFLRTLVHLYMPKKVF